MENCLICNRIRMFKEGSNKFFVKELETGYVVIGTINILKVTRYFFVKNIKVNYTN